jgi:hypothetical protein
VNDPKARPIVLVAVALTAACGSPGSGENAGARLEAEWRGAESVKVAGKATAEWCDSLRVLEIRMLRGDTGIAVAIYPVGQLEPGRFPVVPPAGADTTRPAAAVALRWFLETSVRGFQGDSGQVVVEQAGPGRYAGTFEAKASSVADTASLTIRGSFRGLAVRPMLRGCVARPEPADSGTDID